MVLVFSRDGGNLGVAERSEEGTPRLAFDRPEEEEYGGGGKSRHENSCIFYVNYERNSMRNVA